MVKRHLQLMEIPKLTAERGGKIQLFTREMTTASDAWLAACKAISNFSAERIAALNESLPKTLRIAIEFQGDRDDFKAFLVLFLPR